MNMYTWRVFFSYTIMNDTNSRVLDTQRKDICMVGYSHEEVKKAFHSAYPGCTVEYVRKLDQINHITPAVIDFILLQKSPQYRAEKGRSRKEEVEKKIKANDGDVRMRNMSEVKPEKQDVWGVL